mmetsp:Transcript_10884/g.27472  ORF Transcript_10884/g.27472 Transcript_10884/m.27472 type:complete len:212 (-) Transcript_10884:734-1369(-)
MAYSRPSIRPERKRSTTERSEARYRTSGLFSEACRRAAARAETWRARRKKTAALAEFGYASTSGNPVSSVSASCGSMGSSKPPSASKAASTASAAPTVTPSPASNPAAASGAPAASTAASASSVRALARSWGKKLRPNRRCRTLAGSVKCARFSTMASTGTRIWRSMSRPLSASVAASLPGVLTTSADVRPTDWQTVSMMSPVPGGRSMTR